MEWSEGVAFVKGINFYANNRITQARMLDLCRSIESDDLKIVRISKSWGRFYRSIFKYGLR